MNGCAPGLALIERLKVTRKWASYFPGRLGNYNNNNNFTKPNIVVTKDGLPTPQIARKS